MGRGAGDAAPVGCPFFTAGLFIDRPEWQRPMTLEEWTPLISPGVRILREARAETPPGFRPR
jgi:hypothetical protein